MTHEEKELLLKDLCSRLPYNVLLSHNTRNHIHKLTNTGNSGMLLITDTVTNALITTDVENVKPCLFPLSSMTEEQWNNAPSVNLTDFTFDSLKCGCFTLVSYTCDNELHNLLEFINWLIENHFDINGLIPMGLAIDATGLNIY